MNSEESLSRLQIVTVRLSHLTKHEREEMEDAANSYYEGGASLQEPLRAKAVKLELAYQSTGCLRPDVYKMLQTGGLLVG